LLLFFAFTKVFFHLPDSDKHFYECIIDINDCFKNETIHSQETIMLFFTFLIFSTILYIFFYILCTKRSSFYKIIRAKKKPSAYAE